MTNRSKVRLGNCRISSVGYNIVNAGVIDVGALVVTALTNRGTPAPTIIAVTGWVNLGVVLWMVTIWKAETAEALDRVRGWFSSRIRR